MNIRVLIYMNPLIVDKISKKFLYEKDSGFLYTRQLLDRLPTDWRYTVFVPKNFNRDFFSQRHIIDCVEYDYSTSIHQNRYHFNRNIFAKTLPYSTDIDVVLNMQPEVAANIRVFFENQRREKPIIINFYHWIDCKENRSSGEKYIFRQVEGYNAADLNLFHNQYAFDLFKKSSNEEHLQYKPQKTEFFHPLPVIYGMTPIDLPNKKIILFNHRLNNTTGWKEVIKICDDISCERDDFILWVTDEQNLKNINILKSKKWLHIKSVPFESYGYLLSNAHFSVCNLQRYATWNMAVLDSINHGTPVISNNTALMDTLGAMVQSDLKSAIIKLLDSKKIHCNNKVINDINLTEYIENTIKNRVGGLDIKKYNDVVQLITKLGVCEKRVFVNKLWSFHANSNFQKIRWKLLHIFNDNVSNPYTEYNLKLY